MAAPKAKFDVDNCFKDYCSGFSFNDLAGKYGVSGETIKRRFIERGFKLRSRTDALAISGKKRRVITTEIGAAIVSAYSSGESCLSISKRVGISRPAIVDHLNRCGVRIRGGSDAGAIRMSRLSDAERSALAANAHAALRGTARSFSAKVANAIAKQSSMSGASATEIVVLSMLRKAGVNPIPQLAVGPYNCDLACHPVAVEIFGGHWHFSGRHLARAEERIRYFGNAGWHVLMLVVNDNVRAYTIGGDTADHLIAKIQQSSSDPSAPREYWVIDCRGNMLAGGRCDDDNISIKPAFTHRRDPATGRYERIAR